jgi:ornithine cyclodeaminase/alanine dehydrogenase-like protein (mu-crystallin family)
MSDRTLRFLSSDDVVRALPMLEAIEAMKEAFRELSAGQSEAPPRSHIAIPDRGGDALFMPAYSPGADRVSLKVVTLFEGNRAKGLPFIQALVLVLDGTDGRPLAVMDGASLTAIRTGAASGAATDLLARVDAKTAASLGAGVQARTQLEAVCAVRDIERAWVFDVDGERAQAFADEMAERLGIVVDAVATPSAGLENADIVCAATTSETPVFDDSDLAAGTHINAVGSYKPHVREIPAETVLRARVVVDQREAALEEAGDLILPLREGLIGKDHIHAEIGEIVAGLKAGRQSDTEITFFKSVGVAVQDLAAAGCALANAERLGLGTELRL